jgi:S1-C subfamily serine protease
LIAIVVLALALGALGGHVFWKDSISQPNAISNHPLPKAQSAGTGSSASTGASADNASAVISHVDAGLVDINTNLGYESAAAAGTGMVITSTGEVLTNNHVINGATHITATDLGNGQTYTAHVIGYDYGRDIAILQLENATALHVVELAKNTATVGEHVVTIGNAGGAGGTPSAMPAVVTALNQSVTAGDNINGKDEQLHGMLELQGDLQPGDSGGPLVDNAGDVIAMDTATSSIVDFGATSSDGYAIPIGIVAQTAAHVLAGQATGTIHIGGTAFVGVSLESDNTGPAVVASVLPGTPAAKIKLTDGDTITAINGTNVTTSSALINLLLQHHPGDTVKITWRTSTGIRQKAALALASGPPQ